MYHYLRRTLCMQLETLHSCHQMSLALYGLFLVFLSVPPCPSNTAIKSLPKGNVANELLDACNADSHAQRMFTI